ncbi:MAG: ABC transporter substrate-binding protein [Rhodoferax sp.]
MNPLPIAHVPAMPTCRATDAHRRHLLQALGALSALSFAPWARAERTDVRLGLPLEPPLLDPTRTPSASVGEMLYANLFEGLTILNAKGRVAPRLATAWTLSDDRRQIDFKLRSDVVFHDGKPFTAQSAAWALQRLINPESKNPQRAWFERVTSVQALGPGTLRLGLSAPDPFITYALAQPAAAMVHPDSAATNGERPVGTGPFRFVRWDRGARVVLERSPTPWGKRPALARVEFVFVQGRTEAEALLVEGSLDGLISATDRVQSFEGRPDLKVMRRQVEQKVLVAINNARPPFNDLRVRRALSHAIRRDTFKAFYGEDQQPAFIGSHFAPTHPAYVNLVNRYPFDLKQARALLSAAGVKPGLKVPLATPPTRYGRIGSVSVAEDLENLGFQVDIQNLSWKEWLSQVFEKKDYSLSLISHIEPLDINIYARDGYYFNYANAEFKKIWQQVMDAPTEADLNRLLGLAQRRIAEDAVNVFLFMVPQTHVFRSTLRGMWLDSPMPATVLEDVVWDA